MRLDKLIEARLQTTRKAQKRLFLTGQVKVDGKIEHQENRNVDSQLHKIEVAGRQLFTDERYFLVFKSRGAVTANQDAKHKTVMDLLSAEDRSHGLYSVGRLDRDTEGLLLVTTNGQLGYELLQPTGKGKFQQVKKMFLARGIKVLTLRRVAMGPLTLPQDLLPGAYRTLTQAELTSLREYFR